jgi:hypothetical protein
VTQQSHQGISWQVGSGGTGNTISGNTVTGTGGTGDGILICCDQGGGNVHVTISRNATSSNGGLGIDLAASVTSLGVTPNDAGDGDSGPNNFLNYPEFGAFSDGGKTLNGTACASCLVELFLSDNDPSGHGEGKTFVTDTHADPTGAFSINLCGLGLSQNDIVTATATDLPGNTSEFSQNVLVTGPLGDCLTATPTPAPGQQKQGDFNCDKKIDGLDALMPLVKNVGLTQTAGGSCPPLDSGSPLFGDVNCDGTIDQADALAVLAFAAGASPRPQDEPCTNVGQSLPS